jgi:hypothetical protein
LRPTLAIIFYLATTPAVAQSFLDAEMEHERSLCHSKITVQLILRDRVVEALGAYQRCIQGPSQFSCDFEFRQITETRENYQRSIDEARSACDLTGILPPDVPAP